MKEHTVIWKNYKIFGNKISALKLFLILMNVKRLNWVVLISFLSPQAYPVGTKRYLLTLINGWYKVGRLSTFFQRLVNV